MTDSRDECILIVKRKFNRYKDKIEPWMTNSILRSIKVRDKLHKKLIKMEQNSQLYKNCLTQLNNHKKILKRNIILAKKNYWERQFDNVKNDIKKTWRTINNELKNNKSNSMPESFIVNGRVLLDKNDIVNAFNDYFITAKSSMSSND